jgi:glycoprotein 3-alpha-L-fucosyltransferase
MTYRQDSDIVHNYGRYILRNLSNTIRDYQSIDFYLSSIDNKSTYDIKKEFSSRQNRILWFVSNCNARTKRNKIAKELKNYFPIDQYGQCSSSNKTNNFEQLLFNYKFYLAFENAHCRDYITEKAFYNALVHGSIPIVLGPDKKNYEQILPPNSFIHINHFKNLKQLADHLNRINKNFELFSSYHRWRLDYRLLAWKSNYFIDDRFCDLCIKLHNDLKPKTYSNFSQWLNQCT